MTLSKLLLCLFIALSSQIGLASIKVIYGSDDRYEYYEVSAMLKKISHSTAAQISSVLIDTNGPSVFLYGMPLSETPIIEGDLALCRNERFSEQMSIARCSGFLISPDTLVTAGHCVMNQSDCNENYWVFNFKNTFHKQVETTVAREDVYRCKSIVKQGLNQSLFGDIDFAVIKLDRPNPAGGLKISTRSLNLNDNITMLGHPTGIPLKITTNGKIKRIGPNGYVSDLDAFGGNSGSAVIDSKTGEVVGILTAGQEDYFPDLVNYCARPNRVKVENSSEYISSIKQLGM